MDKYEFQSMLKICEAICLLAENDLLETDREPFKSKLEELDRVYKENHTII